MPERQFRIDTYKSSTDVRPVPLSVTLDELYALLAHEETDCVLDNGTPGCRGKKCPQKDGLAWTAGFINDPCRCGSTRPAQNGRCAECGGKTRLAANVAGLDVAVFDIDHINDQQLEAMCQALEGVELYLHSTHNHLPPDDQSFRLVLPLASTISPDEWKQIWFAIVRKFNLPADKATKDPARLSFFPRAFRGRAQVSVRQEESIAQST